MQGRQREVKDALRIRLFQAEDRPRFSESEAAAIASRHYGISGSIRGLASERDQNFYLEDSAGKACVLKIASASDCREVLDLQNKAMQHIAARDPSLTCPRVLASKGGDTIVAAVSPEGASHWVRVLSFLPGRFLAEVKPHPPELLRSLGTFFGRLDKALADFSHPAARRPLQWDMSAAAEVIRECEGSIGDPEKRAWLERFLELYQAEAVSAFPHLRKSVIHNDGNDFNVLVSRAAGAGAPPWRNEVSGIIDFGDMLLSSTVCDLAIATAYGILQKPNPLEAAGHIIGGYHQVLPLTEAELKVLFPLICIRLATSVALSALQQRREPQNRYLSVSERHAWFALERLASISPSLAHYSFRHACGLIPSPRSAIISRWLRDNREQLGRVVEPELRGGEAVVLDLSAGSSELGDVADLRDTRKFTDQLFGRMNQGHARVGIGRYNEARLVYAGEAFRSEANDSPEWRTVHIGIDLFLSPGAAVFAPLDGSIHSFADNARRFDYGPTIILEHEMPGESGSFYTLYGHLSLDSLEGLYAGKPVRKGDRIATVGDSPLNGDWPPHLHFQIISDILGMKGDFPGVAPPSARKIWLSISPDPNLILGIPDSKLASGELDSEEIVNIRHRHIGRSLSLSYGRPLHIVRGYMQHLFDADGQAYLDAVNNVAHVGHSHPKVVRAIHEQASVLNTNTRYLHENLVRYARRLCSRLPEPLNVCFFVCSGSEANDLALRLARNHTGKRDIVVVDGAYHGNLTSLIEISPYKFDGPGGTGAQPHVHKVPMPDDYRGLYRHDPKAGEKYARHVGEALSAADQSAGGAAAFIAESILGCGGQIVPPPGYLAAAYRLARCAGAVCIADEVQVGFGRTGSHFWGFEAQDVVPDIVTMGKPMGNGHPMAAVVTTPEIAASFDNGMEYFNTFGGNPVSCAAGLAVLEVIEEENLQDKALRVGSRLISGLEHLMARHRAIGDVRGMGLFLGIELVRQRETLEPAAQEAGYVVERMRERRILISTDGPLHNVIKIKPPLVFNGEDADHFISTLDEILSEDFPSRSNK